MVKKLQVNVSMSNKMFYTLILIGVLIISSWIVFAYGGSEPAVMGHSSGEINVDNALCIGVTGHNCGYDNYEADTDTNTWRPAFIVPQGTMCGMNQVGGNGLVSTCIGHNPAASCPAGYVRRWFGESGSGSWPHWSCYKT